MPHAFRPFLFASLTLASSLAASFTSYAHAASADAEPKVVAPSSTSAAQAASHGIHGKGEGMISPMAKRHRDRANAQMTKKELEAKKNAAAHSSKLVASKSNKGEKNAPVAKDADDKDLKVVASVTTHAKKDGEKNITVSLLAPLPAPNNVPVEMSGKHKNAEKTEKHASRADHAVEPETTPKLEATIDPTIHFVPMSATTLSPMDAPIEPGNVKSGKTAKDEPTTPAHGAHGKLTATEKKKESKPCLHTQIDILRGIEEEKLALTKCDGTVAPGALERLSILVRPSSASRPIASLSDLAKVKGPELSPGVKKIDPMLVEHLETVVDHFSKAGEKNKVFVISGYRPGAAGSFHQSGKALDFRIDGVKNEDLVAFCKTLPDTGCGFYPNSSFVHMDIRPTGAGHVTWIDSSGPGEEPRYVSAWPAPAEPGHHREAAAKNAMTQIDKEMPPVAEDEHPTDPEAISDMNQPPPADITTER